VVDVEITRIMKEKEFVIGAFDDAGVVCDGASNDAEDTKKWRCDFGV
jgi:hypothetical protein